MKVTLEFNLPEESSEHRLAIQAPDMHCVLWNFSNKIRAKLKHGQLSDAEEKVWEEVRGVFWALMEDYNVKFED